MGFGKLVKTLVAIYVSVWLLILKKLRIARHAGHHLDQQSSKDSSNLGLFLGILAFLKSQFTRKPTEARRSGSLPVQIHRSTSIRERRRFLSADNDPNYQLGIFAHHQFLLKRRTPPTKENQIDSTSSLKMKCKKSLIQAREAKRQMQRSSPSSSSGEETVGDLKQTCSNMSRMRQQMMHQRGRAFTFPDIEAPAPRARTISEKGEEMDLVMPLPKIPRHRGWKSCNSIHQNGAKSMGRIVSHHSSHHKLKKVILHNNNNLLDKRESTDQLWRKIQKLQKMEINGLQLKKHYVQNKSLTATKSNRGP